MPRMTHSLIWKLSGNQKVEGKVRLEILEVIVEVKLKLLISCVSCLLS
jgi:hypothetical protein